MQAPRRPSPSKRPSLPDTGERLAKRVAQMLPCSRSEAEKYIEGGWVQVNGVVIEEPQFRVDKQTVVIDPNASLMQVAAVTMVLNKPAGVPWEKAVVSLGTNTHWEHDSSGTRPLKRHFQKLEWAVPLETGATGLLAFTQDWRTQRKLVEDMDAMEHEMIADVKGEVSDEALVTIQRALKDERNPLPFAKVSINSSSPERSKLRFAVKGAHPGLVSYLCEKAQLEMLALRRIRLGRVALADLPPGQWRYLAEGERF